MLKPTSPEALDSSARGKPAEAPAEVRATPGRYALPIERLRRWRESVQRVRDGQPRARTGG